MLPAVSSICRWLCASAAHPPILVVAARFASLARRDHGRAQLKTLALALLVSFSEDRYELSRHGVMPAMWVNRAEAGDSIPEWRDSGRDHRADLPPVRLSVLDHREERLEPRMIVGIVR
jgi:hypothetical protein